MSMELKRAILNWLINNQNLWNRLNGCKNEFRDYIYDKDGEFLKYGIGREVSDFIEKAEKLLFREEYK